MFDEQAYLEELKASMNDHVRRVAMYEQKLAEERRLVKIDQAAITSVEARIAQRQPAQQTDHLALEPPLPPPAPPPDEAKPGTGEQRIPSIPTQGYGAINKAIIALIRAARPGGLDLHEIGVGLREHGVETRAANHLEAARNQTKALVRTGKLKRLEDGKYVLTSLGMLLPTMNVGLPATEDSVVDP